MVEKTLIRKLIKRFYLAAFIGSFVAVLSFFLSNVSFAAENLVGGSSSDEILNALEIKSSDIKHYKRAFRYLEKNEFDEAEEEISEVDNDILKGTFLAEKYLSDKYKSSFKELVSWLKKYNGLRQSEKIFKLAQKKRPKKNYKIPQVQSPLKINATPYGWNQMDLDKFSSADRKFITTQVKKFRKALNRGKTKVARIVLENKRFRQLVPNRELDAMAGTLATAYLTDNYDKQAYQWASNAAYRSKNATAAWVAGLSAWRMKQYKNAARNFSILADSGNEDSWLVSAGGYWAYRAYSRIGKKAEARQSLRKAAEFKRTFYGILANYQLGNPIDFKWDMVAYYNDFSKKDYLKEITSSPALGRAIVLLHARQPKLAEKEMRFEMSVMNKNQQEIAMFLAKQNGLHSLSVQLSKILQDDKLNLNYDEVSYPVPEWIPRGGWKADKSFILALTRQESTFNPEAKSPAGACGLMQLLPSTAIHVTQNRSLRRNKKPLMQADYNLAVGQRYVNYLLEKPFIDGNLFYLLTAYNAGPGNLLKWQKRMKTNNDPLLFIEVLPARETRIYIERVMANFWIYQSRFEENLTGIDELSRSEWPHLPRS